jgi:lysophospholipase
MNERAPFFADVADAPPGALAFWLTASDGVRLRTVAWTGGSRGTVVVFPGRTEYAEKYGRVVARLVERGYSALVIDWRGQGLSDRHAAAPQIGWVEDFRHYQRDVAALLALADTLDLPAPRLLLAHSMGGCIGLRTLLEGAAFEAAILSAPMWHLQMRAATRELTSKMTRLANIVGLGGRLTPGASAQPTALAVAFEGNALTGDAAMFDWMSVQVQAHPELGLGGPSLNWTRAALEEMARLYIAPLPTLPSLVFLGTAEEVVSASVIRAQVAKMAAGALVVLDGARHEIFMETPPIQATVWQRIDGFLDALQSRPGAATAASG